MAAHAQKGAEHDVIGQMHSNCPGTGQPAQLGSRDTSKMPSPRGHTAMVTKSLVCPMKQCLIISPNRKLQNVLAGKRLLPLVLKTCDTFFDFG